MDWTDVVRLLAALGMAYGAWQGWRRMPRRIVLEGHGYYRQPGGGFATLWGRRVRDPALAARVPIADLVLFERGLRVPPPRVLSALRAALGAAGAEFTDQDGGGPGVRLRAPTER